MTFSAGKVGAQVGGKHVKIEFQCIKEPKINLCGFWASSVIAKKGQLKKNRMNCLLLY